MNDLRSMVLFFLLLLGHGQLNAADASSKNSSREGRSFKKSLASSDDSPTRKRIVRTMPANEKLFIATSKHVFATIGADGIANTPVNIKEDSDIICTSFFGDKIFEFSVDVLIVITSLDNIGEKDVRKDRMSALRDCLAGMNVKYKFIGSHDVNKYEELLKKYAKRSKAVLFNVSDSSAFKLLSLTAMPRMVTYSRGSNYRFKINGRIEKMSDFDIANNRYDESIKASCEKIVDVVLNRICPGRSRNPALFVKVADKKEILARCEELVKNKP